MDIVVAKVTTMQQLKRGKVATSNATSPNWSTHVVDSLTDEKAGIYELPSCIIVLHFSLLLRYLDNYFCLPAALVLGRLGVGKSVSKGVGSVFVQSLVATLWTWSISCGRMNSFSLDCGRWSLGWRWCCNGCPCCVIVKLLFAPLDLADGCSPLGMGFAIGVCNQAIVDGCNSVEDFAALCFTQCLPTTINPISFCKQIYEVADGFHVIENFLEGR
jgi:hypothetical protein